MTNLPTEADGVIIGPDEGEKLDRGPEPWPRPRYARRRPAKMAG
jgi:hypothetical protein